MEHQKPDKYRNYWRTAISRVERNQISIRGYPLEEISGQISYVDAIILCVRGELPGAIESACVNAIFTSALDHELANTTALAARTVVSANPEPVAGIAAGILCFGSITAGVPALVVRLLQQAVLDHGDNHEAAAEAIAEDYYSRAVRLPGLGNPFHDMIGDHYTFRSQLLRDRAVEAGIAPDGLLALFEKVHGRFIAKTGKDLPINVDGAMGAIFAELNYTPLEVQALAPFTMLPGIAAHVVEEIEDGSPVRIAPEALYVGPTVRHRAAYGPDVPH